MARCSPPLLLYINCGCGSEESEREVASVACAGCLQSFAGAAAAQDEVWVWQPLGKCFWFGPTITPTVSIGCSYSSRLKLKTTVVISW